VSSDWQKTALAEERSETAREAGSLLRSRYGACESPHANDIISKMPWVRDIFLIPLPNIPDRSRAGSGCQPTIVAVDLRPADGGAHLYTDREVPPEAKEVVEGDEPIAQALT
jgi:hypothetical protein